MLTEGHAKAAEVLNNGGTFKQASIASNVPKSTIHKWSQNDPEFQKLLKAKCPEDRVEALLFSQLREKKELEEYRDCELLLTARLSEKLERFAGIIAMRLEELTVREIRDIPVRLLPQLLKSFADGLETLQTCHDRISGYHVLLSTIEKQISSAETSD